MLQLGIINKHSQKKGNYSDHTPKDPWEVRQHCLPQLVRRKMCNLHLIYAQREILVLSFVLVKNKQRNEWFVLTLLRILLGIVHRGDFQTMQSPSEE